ncbi:MAG: alcohol dehydrogenase catalytic domain-containing protein [bacterium]
MKSMVLTGICRMEMVDVAAPRLKRRDDVLIKMETVGVCGSDVHYYRTGRIGSQIVKYPFAVGHEGAGVVIETGAGVKSIKAGDRVAIEPAMSCWKCDQCRVGRYHTCRNLRFLGCPGQAEGCLSEYIVMPESSCLPVGEEMSMDLAALSEPLAIGIYCSKMAGGARCSRVAILGSGPIGLSVLIAERAEGTRKIYMTDKIPARVSTASAMGAIWAGNVSREDVVARMLKLEPAGMDVVYECCGQQEAQDQAIELLKPGGKLVLVGIPTVDRVSFCIDKMRRKEICIQNIRRQVDCAQLALDMIAANPVTAAKMITHRFRFGQTKKAFDLVAGYKDGVVKAMIEFREYQSFV